MDNYSKRIVDLHAKVSKILAHQQILEQEVKKLKIENQQFEVKIQEKEAEIQDLNNKNKILKLAKNISADKNESTEIEKNTELKRKINDYIKEVDKCIAMLNV
jgi:predicted RNase H-like nuclease (RuvC/YqgF family)